MSAKSSKWPWILGGLGVAGAGAYLLSRRLEAEEDPGYSLAEVDGDGFFLQATVDAEKMPAVPTKLSVVPGLMGMAEVEVKAPIGVLRVRGDWREVKKRVGSGTRYTDQAQGLVDAAKSLWVAGSTKTFVAGNPKLKVAGATVNELPDIRELARKTIIYPVPVKFPGTPVVIPVLENSAVWTWHTSGYNYWKSRVTLTYPELPPLLVNPGTRLTVQPLVVLDLGGVSDALEPWLRKIVDAIDSAVDSHWIASAVQKLQMWISEKDPGDKLGLKLAKKLKALKWRSHP